MVHALSVPRYSYAIDPHDAITSVSANWLAFAQENGAPHLTEQAVLGQPLWSFIDGSPTIHLYQAVLQRVRATGQQILLPFRCDSPTLRRYMRLEISYQTPGIIQFAGLLDRVEQTEWLKVLDRMVPRSRDVLTLCSSCKRALIETNGWLEIDDAVLRLHLFEATKCPQLHHSVCPNCQAAANASLVS